MKLVPRRYGPFKVAAKILDIAYWLELPDTWKIHNVFHVSLLMPYKETDKHGPNFLEPPPDLIDGEEEWEIEKILGHRTYRKKKQYLIRWKGYMLLRMDSWYISECFVVSGLPTVWIWDRANVGCHSWNPSSFLLSLCVPLMEGYLYDRLGSVLILEIQVYICRITSSTGGTSRTAPSVGFCTYINRCKVAVEP